MGNSLSADPRLNQLVADRAQAHKEFEAQMVPGKSYSFDEMDKWVLERSREIACEREAKEGWTNP